HPLASAAVGRRLFTVTSAMAERASWIGSKDERRGSRASQMRAEVRGNSGARRSASSLADNRANATVSPRISPRNSSVWGMAGDSFATLCLQEARVKEQTVDDSELASSIPLQQESASDKILATGSAGCVRVRMDFWCEAMGVRMASGKPSRPRIWAINSGAV